MDEGITALLLKDSVDDIVKSLGTMGLTGSYFKDTSFKVAGFRRTDELIDFDWDGIGPDPKSAFPKENFSVRWNGWMSAPANGDYTLFVDVVEADETVNLIMDEKNLASLGMPPIFTVPLVSGKLNKIELKYVDISGKAGVHFSWKTETTPKEVIQRVNFFPAEIVERFKIICEQYHRAALSITGFRLNTDEVTHFIFEKFEFKALTAEQWERINQYVSLRESLPKTTPTLIQVFLQADKTETGAPVDKLIEILAAATGWNKLYLTSLQPRFIPSAKAFKNETILQELQKAIRIATITGMSTGIIGNWIPLTASKQFNTDFDVLSKIADGIIKSVKAKYEEQDWLEVAKGISNKIRENQKGALISYLLVQPELIAWGAVDGDSLFEYFLIDVEMDACMDTSRLVQAISSVQLFVTRCLLNLENKKGFDVAPDAISTKRWEWMKNYRVWEANRKVFLYPENWLEPEWRDDKSPFFKELESELLQNDITDSTVETALRNYLYKLGEVANMEVCGMHQEEGTGTLHVFARTHAIPYKYFYRTRGKRKHWSAWERVPLEIKGYEDKINKGQYSGVHLIPIVWKNRLFLFWPEFMEKQEEIKDFKISSETSASVLKPNRYWEINLAWSEYKDGKWIPKQISEEAISFHYFYLPILNYFQISVDTSEELIITSILTTLDKNVKIYTGTFTLNDISSKKCNKY